ncbi:MAG TPA: DUF4349 domain-containing protein [Puia sp.]|nr:DUF4349 domain-containing protein [Puia sp.]
MRIVVITMLAALLLSLCISCNTHSSTEKFRLLSRRAEDRTMANDVSTAAADSSGSSADVGQTAYKSANKDGEKADEKSADDQKGSGSPAPPAPRQNLDWDRKIVKTANLKIEVKHFGSYLQQLHHLVKESGGYIAQETQSQSDYSIENTVAIKVPVDRFEDLLMKTASDSDKIVEKKINSEDVTSEYVDTRSRLETKKEVRERYLDLLKQARSMKDILAVQNEINGIQEQMDAAAGRIAWLGHSAAYSTIYLDFYQVLNPTAQEETSPSFFFKLKDSIRQGWEWCSSLVLGLISVWPLWIALVLVWFGAKRWKAGLARKPVV